MYDVCREVIYLMWPARRQRAGHSQVGYEGSAGYEWSEGSSVTEDLLAAAGGVAAGAALMYLLDPDRGNRRRAVLRDKMYSAGRHAAHNARKAAVDARNRAYGVAAQTASHFRSEEVSDEKLRARVRAAMGHVVSHAHAIEVSVDRGVVTLCGQVLVDEVDDLTSAVAAVRGVEAVDNRLEVHEHAGGVPSLQGNGRRRSSRYDVMQEQWSPATQAAMGALGLGLTGVGLVRRDVAGAALGVLGAGILTRAATNMDACRLTGVGAGREGVEVHKTININAPVESVFRFWSNYENFPHFMSNVREVRDEGNGRSHWTVAGPAGSTVEWDAEVVRYEPNRMIGWRSVEGSLVANKGMVHFQPNNQGGTRVDIRLAYNPPGGALGHAVAKLFGADPRSEMDQDLLRMKTMIETGNVPRDAAMREGG